MQNFITCFRNGGNADIRLHNAIPQEKRNSIVSFPLGKTGSEGKAQPNYRNSEPNSLVEFPLQ